MILSWWGLTSPLTKTWRLHWATRSPSWPEEPPEETQWATCSSGSWLLAEVTLFLHFRVCISFLVTNPGDKGGGSLWLSIHHLGSNVWSISSHRWALRAIPGRGRGFYNRPSQWVLGEKREWDGKKYVGLLKIDLEYAYQKWVKKGIHVRTTGSERVCPPPCGSESRPEHSFVTESEF